jgi:hypothetical protein
LADEYRTWRGVGGIPAFTKTQLKDYFGMTETLIKKLDDPNERRVMRYYYLTTIEGQLPTWNQVAIRMNYYESYVKKVHGKALANLAKAKNEHRENT